MDLGVILGNLHIKKKKKVFLAHFGGSSHGDIYKKKNGFTPSGIPELARRLDFEPLASKTTENWGVS